MKNDRFITVKNDRFITVKFCKNSPSKVYQINVAKEEE